MLYHISVGRTPIPPCPVPVCYTTYQWVGHRYLPAPSRSAVPYQWVTAWAMKGNRFPAPRLSACPSIFLSVYVPPFSVSGYECLSFSATSFPYITCFCMSCFHKARVSLTSSAVHPPQAPISLCIPLCLCLSVCVCLPLSLSPHQNFIPPSELALI